MKSTEYQKSLHKVVKTAIKVATFRGFMISFSILLLFGGIMMVLAYGAYLVENKEMLPGELTSYIIYTIFIGGSLGGMTNLFADLQKSVGASERILEILEETSEVEVNEPNEEILNQRLQGKISFQDVFLSLSHPYRCRSAERSKSGYFRRAEDCFGRA